MAATKGQTNIVSPKPNQRKRPAPRTDNFLEAMRDLGGSGVQSLNEDFLKGIPQDLMNQLFREPGQHRNIKTELKPGQSVEMSQLLQQEKEENRSLRLQLNREQTIRQEDASSSEQRSQNLKLELNALTQEVTQLAKTTQGLAKETQIAVLQAPANPGVYHVTFFEKLREYIRSFRKKIESASIWMQSYNQRASKKKGFWGQVNKSGSKRLLSPEDYNQRSAG